MCLADSLASAGSSSSTPASSVIEVEAQRPDGNPTAELKTANDKMVLNPSRLNGSLSDSFRTQSVHTLTPNKCSLVCLFSWHSLVFERLLWCHQDEDDEEELVHLSPPATLSITEEILEFINQSRAREGLAAIPYTTVRHCVPCCCCYEY